MKLMKLMKARKAMKLKYTPWGEFCNVFGVTPRNRILECFLEGREVDFSIGAVAQITGLNRATAYNEAKRLIKEKYLIPTRRISGAQFYKLNFHKREVKFLIMVFDKVLNMIGEEHKKKFPQEQRVYA